jgi:tetratricopeptide (TPR) repeat protein
MKSLTLTILTLFFFNQIIAQEEPALPPMSPQASVSRQVGFTNVSVQYGSPAVRGRTIWGTVVALDQVWRAGANACTTIAFSTDVQIGGKLLRKGEYAFFLIPDKTRTWTAVFNTDFKQWGSFIYQEEKDALRTEVAVELLPRQVERLTYEVEEINLNKGLITLSWDNLRVLIPFITHAMEESLTMLENRLKTADADSKFWVYYEAAQFLWQYDGDILKALEYVETSIQLKPFTWNWWTKARLLAKRGDYKSAIAAAEKTISIGTATKEESGVFGVIKNEVEQTLETWKQKQLVLDAPSSESKICIDKAIAQDDSLGKIRNHASETMPLSAAIKQYAKGLARINFRDCPKPFSEAFDQHRKAWLELRTVTDQYPDLRGEMHDLFKQIEESKDGARFKPMVKKIWDTWARIEQAMKE